MRLLVSLVLTAVSAVAESAAPARPPILHYHIAGGEQGPWPGILGAIGLSPGAGGVIVIPDNTVREYAAQEIASWKRRVAEGAILILEGDSPLARSFGLKRLEGKRVPTRNLVDVHHPKLEIVWEKAADIPRYELPAGAQVFARERWQNLPVMAGWDHGAGAVLWLATHPGEKGHERFPYLPQALQDLGLEPPISSRNLWAFFDWSYRTRIDPDYFAERWRKAGISAIHVAAWHFHEADDFRDKYLKALIEACHRRAIQVYAWIELPHVSEKFWQDHPEWREKTAIGQDAHLDWRKLMNLNRPECAREVAVGLHELFDRFDWDGINLAELYFESLEGAANPARFTPMNDDIRREYKAAHGADPAELLRPGADAGALRTFLDWRAELARKMQEQWIAEMETIRARHRNLDLVLTHVDDRYDTRMRDLIGADASRLLPLLNKHDFTFLVEDPATIWHLGPERYPQIAEKYKPITPRPSKLAIDINIVERYQDVYPTKQQTGVELFQLVNLAARAFPRVALYFENSILRPDLDLLPSSAAVVDRIATVEGKLVVENRTRVGIPWKGGAKVNGREWAFLDGERLWLPAGSHVIEPFAAAAMAPRLVDFNGELRSVERTGRALDLAYTSAGRAFAVVDAAPVSIELDGEAIQVEPFAAGGRWSVPLPRGQHLVRITFR